MYIVDRRRCAYCGGCVSVCPVGAIQLQETQLHIDVACMDCGACAAACPMGAIAPQQDAPPLSARPLASSYDLVVVGAGPAGSTAARSAAKAGLSVLLVEKRQEIGAPVRCAEGVGHDLLLPFITPQPAWISAQVNRAQLTVSHPDRHETIQLEGGRGYVLERRIFDRVLAQEAARAGAVVRVKTAAVGLLRQGPVVGGVILQGPEGRREVSARVVIAADGIESQVGAWAGLETTLPLRDAMSCAQYLLANIDIDPERIEYYLGAAIAPGGYAWVFPKGEGLANVGLGLQADLAQAPALSYLERFVESQPHLSAGSPVTLVAGGVPVALPPPRLVTDGLMLVGDAARQVDPLTGGGITNGMTAGKLAAEVAARAIAEGHTSAAALSAYETAWRAGLGRRMARNYGLKEKYGPGQRALRAFSRIFLAAAAGK
ncbi:MAG: geranylgeranyl reductase family protein [Chloroflexota bacterium]